MATYHKRSASAQMIWDELEADKLTGGDGLTRWQIMAFTGLTYGQTNYALGHVKDVLLRLYDQPLVCSRTRPQRYSLPEDWAEVDDYLDFRLAGLVTMSRRLESVTDASLAKWGPTRQIRLAARAVTRLREDLETLAGV